MINTASKTQSPPTTHRVTLSPGKALAWKEWRDSRMIVAGSAILMFICVLVPVIWTIVGQMNPQEARQFPPMWASDFITVWLFIAALSALISGASMVSPEIGSGTLTFLSGLPISRKAIWWSKVRMGLLVILAAALASAITAVLSCVAGSLVHAVDFSAQIPKWSLQSFRDILEDSAIVLGLGVAIFSVGSVVTMLVDRAITSIVVSLLFATVICAAVGAVVVFGTAVFGQMPPADNTALGIADVFAVCMIPACLFAISYKLFTCGETLKTRKRYAILAGYLLPPAYILASLFLAWIIIRS